jgi:hypothetical protein
VNRADRAKIFMPFDALKGLREALQAKEEMRSRVERVELNEDSMQAISDTLSRVGKGTQVKVTFYYNGHYVDLTGEVTDMNVPYRYLAVNGSRIYFADIYELAIVAK